MKQDEVRNELDLLRATFCQCIDANAGMSSGPRQCSNCDDFDRVLTGYDSLKEENRRLREREVLTVGQYTIRSLQDGFYIEHESGEGMGCKADSLEALITQFYAENF